MITIVWFRQDLRVEDNPALYQALERDDVVIPVYIWSPEEEGGWPSGAASRWWIHHALLSLRQDLQNLGLELLIRKGPAFEQLLALSQETGATTIHWNRRYEPWAILRDTKIKTSFHAQGIKAHSFNGSLLFEPWTVLNKQSKPFQVFTPFWKHCLGLEEPSTPLPIPKKAKKAIKNTFSESLDSLKLLPKIPWDQGFYAVWKPGSVGAKEHLQQFLQGPILEYEVHRDRPDLVGISRLSPYLHHGDISVRMVWSQVKQLRDNRKEVYLRQLGWREFAHHLLYHFPSTVEQPLRKQFLSFPWRDDAEQLKAWQKGKTGYPIVDAGMRELWTTGWMHNRVRMVVGSFLVKDLLLPWQEGAKWFWDTLLDADMANNTLGWQWVGGCGADAAPYFRVFNPVTQSEKFDPEGTYVRRWVPEIAPLPTQWIHRPWEAPEAILKHYRIILGRDYPFPLVDHVSARARALETFKKVNENDL